jgi:hypothetical protein
MQVSWSPIASCISTAATEAVDAAGQAADHPALADLGADAGDRLRRGRRPWSSRRAAAIVGEVAQEIARRAGCAPPRDGTARRRICGASSAMAAKGAPSRWRPPRKPGGMAVTRSPWLIHTCSRRRPRPGRRTGRRLFRSRYRRGRIRGGGRPRPLPPSCCAHGLLAVADAQHRHAQLEHDGRRAGRALFARRRWPGRPTG